MARNEARLAVSIWSDKDFLALTAGAQRMFMFLLSQPDLAHTGVVPLRERRWASTAAGLDRQQVAADLAELAEHRFVVVDEDAEEVLVRSFIRRDKVYTQPNVMRAAHEALQLVTSVPIRLTLVAELRRVAVLEMSEHSADVLARMLHDLGADPSGNPPGKGSRNPLANPSGKATANPGFEGVADDPENAATDDDTRSSMDDAGDDTPASISAGDKGSPNPSPNPSSRMRARGPLPLTPYPKEQEPPIAPLRTRGTRLPPDFSVTDSMKDWARDHAPLANRADHEAFCDHWRAQSGQRAVKVDWVATWRNWMRRTQENREQAQVRNRGRTSLTTRHIDDLTPEQRAARNPFAGAVHASQVIEGAS
jgi:hypothetical protein